MDSEGRTMGFHKRRQKLVVSLVTLSFLKKGFEV
jgi:hypothetical protein